MDDAAPLAASGNGSPSETTIGLSKGTANAIVGQPTETVDALGRRHRRDSGGRFCKQDGTNDKQLLPGVDRRSVAFKHYRSIVDAIVADLGGPSLVGEVKMGLVEQYAATRVLADQIKLRTFASEQVSVTEHSLLSSTLKRLAASIGVEREARDITPDPLEYAQNPELRRRLREAS